MQFALNFTGKLPADAQESIANGMKQADGNADPNWKHIFDGCVLAVARRKSEFTSDDVLEEIAALHGAPTTHNLAAIGPAMKRAAHRGVIKRTDRHVRSKVAHKNGNLHAIWRSRFFQGGE